MATDVDKNQTPSTPEVKDMNEPETGKDGSHKDVWSSSFRLCCKDKTGPAWDKEFLKPNTEISELIVNNVFSAAHIKNEKMTRHEFFQLMMSPILYLKLSNEEIQELAVLFDVNKDKMFEPDEISSLCRELLVIYCAKTCTQFRKNWCRVECLQTGDFISVNKRVFQFSYDHPNERDADEQLVHIESSVKTPFDFALAEQVYNLKKLRRQLITKDLIFQALRKYHPLASSVQRKKLEKTIFNDETHPTFKLTEGSEKLKSCICAMNTMRYPKELYTPIFTEDRGLFWINNKTKDTQTSLPPLFIRLLQISLNDRENRLKVIPMLRQREEDAERLEVENAKLEETIGELKENIDFLEKRCQQYGQSVESLERSVEERGNKLSTFKTELHWANEKIRSLERKIQDYERMYTQYEHNKEILKEKIRIIKEKDAEIQQCEEKCADLENDLINLNAFTETIQKKNEVLSIEIREEIKRCERKEMELEKIPQIVARETSAKKETEMFKKINKEKDDVITRLQGEINLYKAEIEEKDKQLAILPEIHENTKYLSCELWTLKALINGKDEVIKRQISKIDRLENPLLFRDENSSKVNRTSRGTPTLLKKRNTNFIEALPREAFDDVDGKVMPLQLEKKPKPVKSKHQFKTNRLDEEPVPDYHDKHLAMYRSLTKGMRVSTKHYKRERYGKIPLAGTILWIGTLDRRKTNHRLYFGLQLDDKVGNTDGIIHGQRLFTCPPGFGKVIIADEILSVFIKKKGIYVPISQFLRDIEAENTEQANPE